MKIRVEMGGLKVVGLFGGGLLFGGDLLEVGWNNFLMDAFKNNDGFRFFISVWFCHEDGCVFSLFQFVLLYINFGLCSLIISCNFYVYL